jgi:hypothetical protein
MNRKLIIGLAAVVTVVVGGGLVWAFWSGSGSASGSGTLNSGDSPVSLTVAVDDGLFPGGSSEVSFEASNEADYDVTIGTLTLKDVTFAEGVDCDPDDFSMEDVIVDQEIKADTEDVALDAKGTLVFENTSENQDECKGAVLTLSVITK